MSVDILEQIDTTGENRKKHAPICVKLHAEQTLKTKQKSKSAQTERNRLNRSTRGAKKL